MCWIPQQNGRWKEIINTFLTLLELLFSKPMSLNHFGHMLSITRYTLWIELPSPFWITNHLIILYSRKKMTYIFWKSLVPSTLRSHRTKLDHRGRKCIFLGFKQGAKWVILLDINNKDILISRIVIIMSMFSHISQIGNITHTLTIKLKHLKFHHLRLIFPNQWMTLMTHNLNLHKMTPPIENEFLKPYNLITKSLIMSTNKPTSPKKFHKDLLEQGTPRHTLRIMCAIIQTFNLSHHIQVYLIQFLLFFPLIFCHLVINPFVTHSH